LRLSDNYVQQLENLKLTSFECEFIVFPHPCYRWR
jgi:hypothetical protein